MTMILEMMVGMPKMSMKRYRSTMFNTDINILTQV